MSDKAEAFKAIRDVVGPEVCPPVNRAAEAIRGELSGLAPHDRPTVREALDVVRGAVVTTHNLRHALAALLVLHAKAPTRCPNCEATLPRHEAKCHVGRLLAALV